MTALTCAPQWFGTIHTHAYLCTVCCEEITAGLICKTRDPQHESTVGMMRAEMMICELISQIADQTLFISITLQIR